MVQTVLVTGASGFVGQAVMAAFGAAGWAVRASTRQAQQRWPTGVAGLQIVADAPASSWKAALQGVDTVVHCAARVHVMRDAAADPLAEFREANVDATLVLARAARAAGVRRFVFISTIGVNGASTTAHPFKASDVPAPHSAYAMSKLEAEKALQALGLETGLEVVVIRPSLVYGPAAPGNFGRLVRAVQAGWPLPLGAVNNQRSLVALGNLASLVLSCASHAAAPGQVFLAGDGEDLSTTELLRRLGQALGRPARLFPVPVAVLRGVAGLLGRPELVQQLCGNLQVDISPARTVMGWAPPLSVAQALSEVASHRTDRTLAA